MYKVQEEKLLLCTLTSWHIFIIFIFTICRRCARCYSHLLQKVSRPGSFVPSEERWHHRLRRRCCRNKRRWKIITVKALADSWKMNILKISSKLIKIALNVVWEERVFPLWVNHWDFQAQCDFTEHCFHRGFFRDFPLISLIPKCVAA